MCGLNRFSSVFLSSCNNAEHAGDVVGVTCEQSLSVTAPGQAGAFGVTATLCGLERGLELINEGLQDST